MALCGVAEAPQINCHSWPFLSLSLFFPSPPLPNSFFRLFSLLFITEVPFMGWSGAPPSPPIGSLCFWSHFMRNACPCLNELIVHMDVSVFCPPGRLISKKFQNMEKKDSAYIFVLTIWPLNIFGCRHIAVWETAASLLEDLDPFFLLPLSVVVKNVVWQRCVVTDSLSRGFYGQSALLGHGYTSPQRQLMFNTFRFVMHFDWRAFSPL